MQLIDTHCHIHEAAAHATWDDPTRKLWQKAGLTPEELIARAKRADVTDMLCVGCSAEDSELFERWIIAFTDGPESG